MISPTDPCSAWTAKANKRVQFGYGLNHMIDTGHAVIVEVEAPPARTYDEVAATRTMIERTGEAPGLKPKHPTDQCVAGAFGRAPGRSDRAEDEGYAVDHHDPLDPNLSVSKAYHANYGMMGRSRDGHRFILVSPDGKIRWRADYGGAPDYTMFLPASNLVARIRDGLATAAR